MSHPLPSLRARQRGTGFQPAAPPPMPIQAPEPVAAQRLAICRACEFCRESADNTLSSKNRDEGETPRCMLFACCHKSIPQTVRLALQQCPAGHWPRWLPSTPQTP